jgi:serine O-acetyltransferase
VLLLRLQVSIHAAGRLQLARAVSLLNLRLTGAEFVVGCRVGPGLVVRHPHGVVVGRGTVIGEDCTILQRVTLGERYGDGADLSHVYPRLGARVVVGAGAAILGGVRVGDDAVVGANAVVLQDVEAADVVVGVPARSTKVAEGAETAPSGRQAR